MSDKAEKEANLNGMSWKSSHNFDVSPASNIQTALEKTPDLLFHPRRSSADEIRKLDAVIKPEDLEKFKGKLPFLEQKHLQSMKQLVTAIDTMVKAVKDGTFRLDEKNLSALQKVITQHELSEKDRGHFRDRPVKIVTNPDYQPIHHDKIPEALTKGFAYLQKEVKNPAERAFATYFFIAKIQPYANGNKRLAGLVANAMLLQSGHMPTDIVMGDHVPLTTEFRNFYDSNDATKAMSIIEKELKVRKQLEFAHSTTEGLAAAKEKARYAPPDLEQQQKAGGPSGQVGKPSPTVGQPENKVGSPSPSVGKPVSPVGKPTQEVGKPQKSWALAQRQAQRQAQAQRQTQRSQRSSRPDPGRSR